MKSLLFLLVAIIVAVLSSISSFTHAHGRVNLPVNWKNQKFYDDKYQELMFDVALARSAYEAQQRHEERLRQEGAEAGTATAPPPFSNKSCGTCLFAAQIAVSTIESAAGVALLEGILDKDLCQKKFNSSAIEMKICQDVVKFVVPIINKYFKLMTDSGWNLPHIACDTLFRKCEIPCCSQKYAPEQRMLAFASKNIAGVRVNMRITFVTLTTAADSMIQYRINDNKTVMNETKSITTNTYSPIEGWLGWITSGVMPDLPHSSNITYRVGSPSHNAWSKWATFRTLPVNIGTKGGRPLRVVQIGDMGVSANSSDTRRRLLQRAKSGDIDFIVHNGDISYENNDAELCDAYFREISTGDDGNGFSAIVPYMLVPGNHEIGISADGGAWYKARIKMLQAGHGAPSNALYYDFYVGEHPRVLSATGLDSESTIDTPYFSAQQQSWAQQVLSKANQEKGSFSWVFFHRPLYCSTAASSGSGKLQIDCTIMAEFVREQVEKILVENKVDLVSNAHMHNYQRTHPVEYGQVVPAGRAPVYAIQGSAGQAESMPPFAPHPLPWSAKTVSGVVSYSLLEFTNDGEHTSCKYEVHASSTDEVIDSFTLTSGR